MPVQKEGGHHVAQLDTREVKQAAVPNTRTKETVPAKCIKNMLAVSQNSLYIFSLKSDVVQADLIPAARRHDYPSKHFLAGSAYTHGTEGVIGVRKSSGRAPLSL